MGVCDDYDAFIDNSSFKCYCDKEDWNDLFAEDNGNTFKTMFPHPESAYRGWHEKKRVIRSNGTITSVGRIGNAMNGDFEVVENGDKVDSVVHLTQG